MPVLWSYKQGWNFTATYNWKARPKSIWYQHKSCSPCWYWSNPYEQYFVFREVGKALEEIAWKTCKEAANLIRTGIMITNTAEFNNSDLVSVPCSFDISWQKRGKGHSFLTGQGAIMSLATKEAFRLHKNRSRIVQCTRLLRRRPCYQKSFVFIQTRTVNTDDSQFSRLKTTQHAAEDMKYLDHRHGNVQTFNAIQFYSQTNIYGILEKIAGACLSYKDLRDVHDKYRPRGLIFAFLLKSLSNYISIIAQSHS